MLPYSVTMKPASVAATAFWADSARLLGQTVSLVKND